MPFLKVRDIQLYYERQGMGPKLLYINGTGGDLPNCNSLTVVTVFSSKTRLPIHTLPRF